jgi:hypothetical protein
MRRLILAGHCIAGTPALAQEARQDKGYARAGIAESAARLACFDSAVAGLKQAHASGGVAVVSRARIDAAEKEAFGLEQPSLSALAHSAFSPTTAPAAGVAPALPELDRVQVTITAVERRATGADRFTMANGQVWEQTDAYDLGRTLKAPVSAEIRKAAVGSFMLKVGDEAAVRARRKK